MMETSLRRVPRIRRLYWNRKTNMIGGITTTNENSWVRGRLALIFT
jgi:hypothetical protein